MRVENVEEENDDLKQKQCWWFSSGNQGLILPPPSLFPLMEKLLLSNQRWESKYIHRCDLASRTWPLHTKVWHPQNIKIFSLKILCSGLSLCSVHAPASKLSFFAFCWMIKEAKFFLQELIEVERRNFLVHRQVVHTAHCSSIKLWTNALSSSPLCFKYPFSTKQLWKPKIWGSSRVIYGTQKSSNNFDLKRKKGRGVTECQFLWQKTPDGGQVEG